MLEPMLILKIAMVLTFLAAIVTLLMGVFTMSSDKNGARSNLLMFTRVGLCIALIVQIIIYLYLS